MFADDLVTLLVNATVGVANTNIFISSAKHIPSGDGPYISIIETGGTSKERSQTSNYKRPGAQITVIGKGYTVTMSKAVAACNALNVRNRTINGNWYRDIDSTQEPFDLGLADDGIRSRVAFNVRVK